MLGSLFGLIGDTAKVVLAPVEFAASVARVVTEPVADVASSLTMQASAPFNAFKPFEGF